MNSSNFNMPRFRYIALLPISILIIALLVLSLLSPKAEPLLAPLTSVALADEDVSSEPQAHPVTIELQSAPILEEPTLITVTVASTSTENLDTGDIILRLPQELSVTQAYPLGYDQPDPEPYLPRYHDVVWRGYTLTTVADVFTVTVVPTGTNPYVIVDQVEGQFRYTDTVTSIPQTPGDLLEIVISDSIRAGQVSDNITDTYRYASQGFVLHQNISGQVIQTDTTPATYVLEPAKAGTVPELKPLSVGMTFTEFTDPESPFSMTLVLHNTVTHELEVSGTVLLPDGWIGGSVSPVISTTIQPDEYFEYVVVALAPSMECRWTVTTILQVPEDESGDEITYYQDGGIFPCPESEVWDESVQAGAVFVGSGRIGIKDRNEDCWWCEAHDPCVVCDLECGAIDPMPGQGTMLVTGKIDALSTRGDSYLARLQIRIWAGLSPAVPDPDEGNPPPVLNGILLAETRLKDDGSFSICVPYVDAIFLEVTATDEAACNGDWFAQTLEWNAQHFARWHAISPTYIPVQGCSPYVLVGQQYVNQWAGTTVGRAHFPATMIAYDLIEFMKTSGEPVNATTARTSVVYPWNYISPCKKDGQACYRSPRTDPAHFPFYNPKETIFLYIEGVTRARGGGDDAENGALVDHEFGHRAQDGMRGFVFGSVFQEGIGHFWRAIKEHQGAVNRGLRNELSYDTFDDAQYTQNQLVPFGEDDDRNYIYYTAWLVDIMDSPDFLAEASCQGDDDFQEQTSASFSSIWPTFGNPMISSPPGNSSQYWGEKFFRNADPTPVAVARNMSIAHRIYECADLFPGASPTPGASQTPFDGITATPTATATPGPTNTPTRTPTRTPTATPTIQIHP